MKHNIKLVSIISYAKKVFAYALAICLFSCKTINIDEKSFLKNEAQNVLYHLAKKGKLSSIELSVSTGYSLDVIERLLKTLSEKDKVISENNRWYITEEVLTERDGYRSAIRNFNILEEKVKYTNHDLNIYFLEKSKIEVASFVAKRPTSTLIFFGGNGFSIVPDIREIGGKMLLENTNFFTMNYPGMGGSSEDTTIETIQRDADVFIQHVMAQDKVKNTKIVIYGFSLGGFVATQIASKYKLDGLILDSTAPDMQSWMNAIVPHLAKAFVKIEVDSKLEDISNLKLLQNIKSPILFIGGSEDEITPANFVTVLSDASSKSVEKKLIIFDGAGHGETPDHKNFKDTIQSFILSLVSMD